VNAAQPLPIAPTAGRVEAIDPVRDPRWRAFVEDREDATIYHDGSWFEVLERTYRYRSASLACVGPDGSLLGILPMVEKPSLKAGRHLSSLPHTPAAGPIAVDEAALRGLLTAAVARVDGRSRRWLELKVTSSSLTGLVDGLVGGEWDPTYLVELPERPEDLRVGGGKNRARAKWSAKKARSLGVEVRSADARADLERWYPLYLDTMRSIPYPAHPYRMFEALWDVLRPPGKMELLLAELRTDGRAELLAGSMFLRFGRTCSYAFTGRRADSMSLHPNDALQFHAITAACRDGMRYYDLGKAAAWQTGLVEFKTKWGGLPRPLYRYHYPRAHDVEAEVLGEEGWVRRLRDRTWRALPLGLTARLGSVIYRWL
jgi:hypothetical protein